MEAETNELVVNLLLGGEAGVIDIRLNQHRTDFAVAVFGKANHAIWASIEVLVVRLDALEERGKVVVGIAEIVELDDILTIGREISFVFRATVEEIAKLAAVAKPAALFLRPLAESYQLD